MKRPPSAIWLVHKPVGSTSAALVDAFRAEHAGNFTLKVSHGGVLDPFAEGLVLLLVGAANRLFELLHEAPKTYVATVAWGAETDTGDAGGKVVARGEAPPPTDEQLAAALAAFTGWTEQVPPATSNKRVGGERAYVRAHRGETVELEPVKVFASSLSASPAGAASSTLHVVCRGGFYVRSLARDLGRRLGCRAHLAALSRTAIGPWKDPPPGERIMISGRDVLPWLPSRELADAEWGALRAANELAGDGVISAPAWALPPGFPAPSPLVRAFHQGRLVALLEGRRARLVLPGGI